MNSTVLLRKLIAIERLVGRADSNTLRSLLFEIEEYVIAAQKQQAESFLSRAWRDEVTPPQRLRNIA